MSNFDPNFPNRDPAFGPMSTRPAPSGWTLGIGVAVIVLIVGFLAFGHNHNGEVANVPPGAPTALNPAPNASPASPMSPPATATLPAARTPAETTGSAPAK